MGWWGKLVGGALGFAVGGPLGALLGAAMGHNIDVGMAGGRERLHAGDQERVQTAFFTATFSIMGYVAKADGHVSRGEIAMAKQFIMLRKAAPSLCMSIKISPSDPSS